MTTWSPIFFASVMAPFLANGGWFASIYTLCGPIYWMMATLALGWVLLNGAIGRDVTGMASDLGITIMGLGAGWCLFNVASSVGYAIYTTFQQLGGEVGGIPQSALSPDGLMILGFGIFQTIWSAVSLGTWFRHPLSAIIIALCAVIIFLLYLYMSINLMLLVVEAFFAIIGGSIFLPFGAFHWTREWFSSWLSWILGAGIQLFFTYLVLSVGLQIVGQYATDIETNSAFITGNLTVAVTALAQALLFWTLLVFIPKQARRRIDGSVSPYLGTGTIMGVLGAALSTGGAAAGVASKAASAAADIGSTHSQEIFGRMMTS